MQDMKLKISWKRAVHNTKCYNLYKTPADIEDGLPTKRRYFRMRRDDRVVLHANISTWFTPMAHKFTNI
jgi:hypothetical protein